MSFQVGRSAKSFLMRQHLSRDLKEVREQTMRMSEGRVLQAKEWQVQRSWGGSVLAGLWNRKALWLENSKREVRDGAGARSQRTW